MLQAVALEDEVVTFLREEIKKKKKRQDEVIPTLIHSAKIVIFT